MDPFTALVLAAIGTAVSGAVSGAGGEVGRRSSEALFRLLRRTPRSGPGAVEEPDGADATGAGTDTDRAPVPPVLPVSAAEQHALAVRLGEQARSSPEFAREVLGWARGTEWLAPRLVAAVAQHASCPQLLPPGTGTFTDRESVLASVTQLYEGGGRPGGAPAVVLLTGPGGIGKSATAVHCAHLLKDRFPDGQLHVDLKGGSPATALSPSGALTGFLRALRVPDDKVPGDAVRQAELYRDCTAGRRLLVVLDNAASDAQVEPLLPAARDALVLVTSRRRLDGLVARHGARPHTLPPLSPADSVRLLTRMVGLERMAGRETVALAVAEKCGGNPLALSTTGARLSVREHLTLDAVERQLSGRADHRDEEGLPVDDRAPGDAVALATDASYDELTPQCALLYRMLGIWDWPDITVSTAMRAADIGADAARAQLEQLAEVHLLAEVGEERYRFHDLVRAHARQRAEAEDGYAAMAAAVRRMAAGYLRFAAAAEYRVIPARWRLGAAYLPLTLPPDRDPADGGAALAELRAESGNLAAAVRAADQYGYDDLVWQLCEATWGLHLRLGLHEMWLDTHLRGVEAARRCAAEFGDARAEARMRVQLGFAYLGLGRLDEAETSLLDAAAADERVRHHRGQASAVEALGLLRLKRWKYPEAERCFTEAQLILGRIRPGGDGERDRPRALALLEHHLGRALRGQGRFADASRQLHAALDAFGALDQPDRYNEGRVYMSLGETHLDAGEPERARECLDRALATMDAEGAELQQADAAELRARCHREAGDSARAADDLRKAAALYETAGDALSVARVRGCLAELG